MHLHVVVVDVYQPAGITIIVPCETYNSDKQDRTTLLNVGDHEFITGVTYVDYRRARVTYVADLDKLSKSGVAKPKPPLGKEVLERVRRGMTSRRTNPEAKELYMDKELFGNL